MGHLLRRELLSGWQQNLKVDYGDLEWTATGERLTRESFERYRKEGDFVVIDTMKDANIERAGGARHDGERIREEPPATHHQRDCWQERPPQCPGNGVARSDP
jgi:hypothetical protein